MEELSSFASAAQSDLSALWTGAGLPPAEQQEQIIKLVAAMRELVANTVKEEQEKLEGMRAEMPERRAELEALRETLGGDVRAVAADDSQPLIPQHRALIGAIDAAKTLKSERLEQRKAKEEKLEGAQLELDGEEGPAPGSAPPPTEPTCDEAGGLSLALLGRLQARVDALMDEKAARLAVVGKVTAEADSLRRILGYPAEEAESPPNVSRAAVAAAEATLQTLVAERAKRQAILADCSEYIAELRAKLQIKEEDWTPLPNVEEAGLSPEVLAAYNVELERLEQIKAQTLGPLLEAARARLRPLWVELHMSEEETKQCAAAWSTKSEDAGSTADLSEHTAGLEDELEAVEDEERRLLAKKEQTSRVFALMTKRETILEQRAEMVACQKDPSRLLNRRDPGRLLREERLRKEIANLPKMNAKLRELAKEWSDGHGAGRPLTYDGEPLVELLARQEEEDKAAEAEERRLAEELKKQRNEEKLAAKQGAAAGKGGPVPRPSKSAPVARTGGAAAPRGVGAFKAAAKMGALGSAAQAAVAAASATAVPPPPPGPPPPETPVHAQPDARVLQTLAAAQGNGPTAPTTPTKAVAAAAAPAQAEAALPVVN